MKRFLSLLLVAILGGLVALGMQQLFFKPQQPQVMLSPSGSGVNIPAAFTNYLSHIPNSLPDFTLVAEMTVHAVVHIRTEYERKSSVYDQYFGADPFEFFFGPRNRRPQQPQRPIQASGSGVLVSADGYIITNNHVVQEADLIEVTLNDNRTYEAVVVGLDPTTDLALIKIDEKDLPYLVFGDSDEVKVGEWVLAVGNPFNLTSTVTAGIVSAKGRQINILGGGTSIESFIQTDAAVNRGNSGGALVNTNGQLIGVNAAIASNTGSFTGYSFAIPANIARKVMTDLKEFGEVQRGLMNVGIEELNARLVREMNLSINRGVLLRTVEEKGAADAAGLKPGDVITAIDGSPIRTTSELQEAVGRKRPGDEILVTYHREGRNREAKVRLRNVHGDTSIVKRGEADGLDRLGGKFENVAAEDLKRLNISGGVRVASVGAGGPLRSAGVRDGYIITQVDRKAVNSVKDLSQAIAGKKGGVLFEGIYPNGTRVYYGVGL